MEIRNSFRKSDLKKGLKIPLNLSENICELIGIHFGDGHMTEQWNHTYKISYCFNIRDRKYSNYINNLFKKVFGTTLISYESKNKNCLVLYLYSKVLCNYLNKELGIPFGPKNNLNIPKYVLSNRLF